MKKYIIALIGLLFAALVILDKQEWLKPPKTAPQTGVIRMLSLPPKQMELSSPLIGYRCELPLAWKSIEKKEGCLEYFWEGYLDCDEELPGIEAFTGQQKIPFVAGAAFPTDSALGYQFSMGRTGFNAQSMNLPSPYDDPLAYQVLIPFASPLLVFHARKESQEVPRLEIGIDSIWSASLAIDSPTWKVHTLAPEGIAPGTHTLKLDGSRSSVPMFFMRDFHLTEPSRIRIRTPLESPEPKLIYRPDNPLRSLLESPAIQLAAPLREPWAIYDENEDLVKTIEIAGIARTGLFMPTLSEWRAEVDIPSRSTLRFYPAIQHPIDPSQKGKAKFSVEIVAPVQKTLWQGIISNEDDKQDEVWRNGIVIPLADGASGKTTLKFQASPLATGDRTQPVILGEPCILPEQGEAGPSIILISIDTMRADAISCLGYKRKTTPWMEEFFGRQGVMFSQVEAPCTWTLPSHASLFLSQYVSRHGVGSEDVRINSEVSMLAERLAAAGYETAAFIDRGFMESNYGFAQGFMTYDQNGGHFVNSLPRAAEWLRNRRTSAPFFLFLHTYDVHAPYNPPEPHRSMFVTPEIPVPTEQSLLYPEHMQAANRAAEAGRPMYDSKWAAYWRALYDGGIHYVDMLLRDWFQQIHNESSLTQEPIVILFSDHGESFYEHGSWAHGWNLYEELTRVPILIHFPGGEHRGKVFEERVSLIDLAPTLYDCMGWELPEDWQGESLMPLIDGSGQRKNRNVYAELSRAPFVFSASFKEDLKHIETESGPQAKPPATANHEVYDLKTDPGEKTNLADEKINQASSEFEKMEQILSLMKKLRQSEGGIEGVELNADDVRELQRLGYLR